MDLTYSWIKQDLLPNQDVGQFGYDYDLYITLTNKWILLHKQTEKFYISQLLYLILKSGDHGHLYSLN